MASLYSLGMAIMRLCRGKVGARIWLLMPEVITVLVLVAFALFVNGTIYWAVVIIRLIFVYVPDFPFTAELKALVDLFL